MADQILDARTLLWDGGDGTGGAPDDLAGSALSNSDTSTFIEGSTSEALSITNSVLGMLFDAGSAQDYSSNTFHLWVNCGVVGLLLAKASGGLTVRFCGATVSDWFEVYVAGNDSFPVTFEGGWAVFVIDIEDAHTNSDATNGTKPATNAIRYVGITAETSVMPKMSDNLWMDAIYVNPTADAAWTVEGQESGTTDWTMADVASELGVGAGLVIPIDGDSFYVTGPGQFGVDDTETHGFTSLNDTILWADQEFVLDGYYGFRAVGNSGGTTNVTFGAKTGTGDNATGAQGASIKSGAANSRFALDFNDPDLDLIAFYGCSLIHGGDFLLDDPAVSFISTLFIDCDSALVSNAEILRCSILAANTADGVAFMTTDDLSDIVFSTFEFSDGHAIELTTPNTASQTSKGNIFTGYAAQGGNANDRMVYNNSGSGLVTISVTESGTTITYRNGTSATTDVVASVTLTVEDVVPGSSVYIEAAAGGPESIGTILMDEPAIPSAFGYFTSGNTDQDLETIEDFDMSSTSGDFELIALVRALDWTDGNQTVFAQFDSSDRSMDASFETGGALRIRVDDGGGAITLTSDVMSLTDDTWVWLRVVYDASAGDAFFYSSTDSEQTHPENVAWTAQGTPTDTSTLPQSLAIPFTLGASDGTARFHGRIAYVSMWTDGTTATGDHIFEFDGRTGPDFDGSDLRKLEWGKGDIGMFGTTPVYTTAPTTLLDIEESYAFVSTQPVLGRVRQSSQAPKQLPYDFTGTVVSGTGITHVAAQQPDNISP